MHRGLSTIAVFFSLAFVASAMTIPCDGVHGPQTVGRVFIGYKGFSADPRPPQASAGGELGAVFYVADAVDLAKSFAHGPVPAKDTVCLIHADATEWNSIPKAWVPAAVLAGGGAAVNAFVPGAVVLAAHNAAALPAGSPANVYQLGIRQAQIARLQLTMTCRPRNAYPDNEHQTLNYPSLNLQWHIHPLWLWELEGWREFLMNMAMAEM
ncbi:hypothetical protein BJ912DRAFT_911186 [Pholiota molesta]|nr:hypothetical protein BJ912DRAFT_911186 [Pholiota molesta]